MPTVSEYLALGNAVTTAWTADYQSSGVAGMICTDKTDSSKVLFFPACGYFGYGSVNEVGSYGNYLSSSLSAECGEYVSEKLRFAPNYPDWSSDSLTRAEGFVVRGILDE